MVEDVVVALTDTALVAPITDRAAGCDSGSRPPELHAGSIPILPRLARPAQGGLVRVRRLPAGKAGPANQLDLIIRSVHSGPLVVRRWALS
jgi:hypothetical protein